MIKEESLIFKDTKAIYFYFFLWDNVEKNVLFKYIVFFQEKKKDKILSYFDGGEIILKIKSFIPYFKEWIDFIDAELSEVEFTQRFRYVNSKIRQCNSNNRNSLKPEEKSFQRLLGDYFPSEMKYLKNELKLKNYLKTEKRKKTKLKFEYTDKFKISDLEKSFQNLIHIPFWKNLYPLLLESKESELNIYYPNPNIKNLCDNLINISYQSHKPDEKIKDRITTFQWKNQGPSRDVQITFLLKELQQEQFIPQNINKETFIKAFNGSILNENTYLDIPFIYKARNQESNLRLLLFTLIHLGEENIINPKETSTQNSFYQRVSRIFVKINIEIDNEQTKERIEYRRLNFRYLRGSLPKRNYHNSDSKKIMKIVKDLKNKFNLD